MNLESLVSLARRRGASDLHLEPGLPAALRVRGELSLLGEPLSAGLVRGLVREAVSEENWQAFRQRGSFDLARNIGGARCRINALTSMRGVGLAVRLLPSALPTVESLNLHPDLKRLVAIPHGLLLVSGPTGCGKSSTVAALLQEVNRTEACHVVTVEQPIEYVLRPDRAFIRQREVGRDTPSFDQALLDAMREDPDVLVVGELREPQVMRLALNAAETGHLVISTVHSSSPAEALQRIILAFPAEIQAGITAQLADCLVAVVAQRLVYRPGPDLRLPECEVLVATQPARAVIRTGEFFKLGTVMETGGREGCWTRERYRAWLDTQREFQRPAEADQPEAADLQEVLEPPPQRPEEPSPRAARRRAAVTTDERGVLVIEVPDEDASEVARELERSGR